MSVLGIDIGTSFCVLATIQRGAVLVIRNDLSERLTPSLVGFTDKERLIGEEAQSQMRFNFKNTCRYIKQLLACSDKNCKELEEERRFKLCELAYGSGVESGTAGYLVKYKGEDVYFAATRILAALLTKLKCIAEKATGTYVCDVVIGVPCCFSDRSRQAVVDAAFIAGLKCLRTMNEHAAIALDYGMFRCNSFEAESPTRVIFVSIGHGMTTVSVVEFLKGKLRILGVAYDKDLSGRAIDYSIMEHYASIFESTHKINLLENRKSFLKLEESASKAKKILSANCEAPFNIECVFDEYDINELLTREHFEAICSPFQERLKQVIQSSVDSSNITIEDIHHVELVGGCSRIPCFQKTIFEFFNGRLTLSKTLSTDETVAKGCALQAAMLNPRYRVREFNVLDKCFHEVYVEWATTSETGTETIKRNVLFEKNSILGSTKWLTFDREKAFDISLVTSHETEPLIARIEPPTVPDVDPEATKRIKIKVVLSHYGIIAIEEAQLIIEEKIEEANKTEAKEPTTEATQTKKKIKTKRFNCEFKISPRQGYLTTEMKNAFLQKEIEMAKEDVLQQETKEAFNELEAYVYDLRDKLSNNYSQFATAAELRESQDLLQSVTVWLDENFNASREDCRQKLELLKSKGDPIIYRYNEYHGRESAYKECQDLLQNLRLQMASPEYSHVEPCKMLSLKQKIDDMETWLNQVSYTYSQMKLSDNPNVTCSTLHQEAKSLLNFSHTILTIKKDTSIPVETDPLTAPQTKKKNPQSSTKPDDADDQSGETLDGENHPMPADEAMA